MQDPTSQINNILLIGTSVTLLMGVGLLLLGYFYYIYVREIKIKEKSALAKNTLESETRERKRIADDLHDSVLGDLTALNMFFTVIEREDNALKDNAYYPDLKKGVQDALLNTRQVSYGLKPPSLESLGLIRSLDGYFKKISVNTGINFTVNCNTEISLDIDLSYELFKVIQEFSSNFIKYGKGKSFKVAFKKTKKHLIIEIQDDGILFNFHKKSLSSGGNGLGNIQSRLKAANATMLQVADTNLGNHFVIELKNIKC